MFMSAAQGRNVCFVCLPRAVCARKPFIWEGEPVGAVGDGRSSLRFLFGDIIEALRCPLVLSAFRCARENSYSAV